MKSILLLHKSKIWILGGQMLSSGSSFILVVLLGKYLMLEGLGVFSLGIIIAQLFLTVNQALVIKPMYTLGIKAVETGNKNYFSQLFGLQALLLIAYLIIAYLLCLLNPFLFPATDLELINSFLPFTVVGVVLFDFVKKRALAIGRSFLALKMDVLYVFFLFGGMYMLKYLSVFNLKNVFALYTGIFLFVGLLFGTPLIRFNGFMSIKSLFRQQWSFVSWIWASSVVQWFSGNIFVLVAGSIIGPAVVGAFRLVQNIMGVIHVLFAAIENYVPVSASKIYLHSNFKQLRKYLESSFFKTGVLYLTFLLPLLLFPEWILRQVYNAEAIVHAGLLRLLGIGYFFIVLNIFLAFMFRTIENTRSIFKAYFNNLLLSLLFVYPLLKLFGATGIVLGILSGQLVMTITYFVLLQRKQNIENFKPSSYAKDNSFIIGKSQS